MNTLLEIHPSSLTGTITPPPSKSHTMRALIFAMMAKGVSTIYYPLRGSDTNSMLQAMNAFGISVQIFDDRFEVEGSGGSLGPATDVIDAGNSGQILRFLGALAALSDRYTIFTGDHSIRHSRPVAPLLEGLSQLGAFATSSRLDGRPPIIIRGPLRGGKAVVNGEDSQPISALLIASSFLREPTELIVQNPKETPWIDLTLSWLQRLNIAYLQENYQCYRIQGGASYTEFSFSVPADFSSAAYPIATALVTDSEIGVKQLDFNDVQGDKALIYLLQEMGAQIEIIPEAKMLKVKRGSRLKGKTIDVNPFIDALPLLAVIGCFAEGKTELVNGLVARKKESDRIKAICTELKKMGAHIEERPDGLIVHRSILRGTHLTGWHDHRIVLSLIVAAAGAKGNSRIDGAQCIDKSYPSFFHDMQQLGLKLESHFIRL